MQLSHTTYRADRPSKALFTEESKKALIALLNVVLERRDDPIVDLVYLNPISYPEDPQGKLTTMDIKVQTNSGERIDIEIQVCVRGVYGNRSIYYEADLITESLEKGQDYANMKKSIVISIMDEKLFPQTERFHTVFRYAELTEGFPLSDVATLHFLELSKIDITKPIAELTELEQLGAYIKYAADESKADYIKELLEEGGGAGSGIDPAAER